MKEALWLALVGLVVLIVLIVRFAMRAEWRLGTPTQRAALATLHTANLAAPAWRTGLSHSTAERSVSYVRQLIGGGGVAIADTADVLAADGLDDEHCLLLRSAIVQTVSDPSPPRAVTARTGVHPGWCLSPAIRRGGAPHH